VEKHLEMAVEVIHERIRLDQQRVSPDAAEVLRGIDARLFDPRFKAGSLSPTKKVRESFREVFRAVGYADPPQFRRAFKTWSGALAPDEYRTRVRHVASRVGPAPARFINWRYLEHVRGPAPKEALEVVCYVESVYSFVSPIHVDGPAPLRAASGPIAREERREEHSGAQSTKS
jgi:AraC-like DNA-binding protein